MQYSEPFFVLLPSIQQRHVDLTSLYFITCIIV